MTAFDNAAKAIKDSGKEPGIQKITNDEKLALYGLFKQGTVGDVNTAQPSALQLEANAKWGAWNKNKGKGKEQAQNEYIELVKTLLTKYGIPQYIKDFWWSDIILKCEFAMKINWTITETDFFESYP